MAINDEKKKKSYSNCNERLNLVIEFNGVHLTLRLKIHLLSKYEMLTGKSFTTDFYLNAFTTNVTSATTEV